MAQGEPEPLHQEGSGSAQLLPGQAGALGPAVDVRAGGRPIWLSGICSGEMQWRLVASGKREGSAIVHGYFKATRAALSKRAVEADPSRLSLRLGGGR